MGLLAHSGNDPEPSLPSQLLREQKGPAMRGQGCFCRKMGSKASGCSHHGLVELPVGQGGHEAVPFFNVSHHSMSLKTKVATETCLPLRTFAQDGSAPQGCTLFLSGLSAPCLSVLPSGPPLRRPCTCSNPAPLLVVATGCVLVVITVCCGQNRKPRLGHHVGRGLPLPDYF